MCMYIVLGIFNFVPWYGYLIVSKDAAVAVFSYLDFTRNESLETRVGMGLPAR